ncbi:ribosomal protein S18-alanine N-acetyltransferase [Ornithinimicrobium cavernae]|uniref:ribosomal protein S18-alanine N-acetyltransferase n=1 Tax=Ornithinimicrobium cavernae TaxID=2666047 RepID=UPI001EFF9AEB|nr:ribosomal protein S18-alanine N-acetyltransferase [Ornithinimicrobium cavernae]
MSTTRLRPMRWQDLPEVHRLELGCFPQDPWSPAGFWAELAARPRRDYVVLEDDGLVGYAGLDLAGETADVMTIATDPARRGQGHGQVLLDRLLQRAAGAGASQVMLEVREDNEAAIALYARNGFAELHRRRGYYQPGGVDALIMRKEVTRG